jgi:hypothetical protein
MVKTILTDDHPSRPAFASCVEQYLTNPTQAIKFQNALFPMHIVENLQLAINEQHCIGWSQLTMGYL